MSISKKDLVQLVNSYDLIKTSAYGRIIDISGDILKVIFHKSYANAPLDSDTEFIYLSVDITDVKNAKEKRDSERHFFAVGDTVVPYNNPNSHNYKIGIPILINGNAEKSISNIWYHIYRPYEDSDGNNIYETDMIPINSGRFSVSASRIITKPIAIDLTSPLKGLGKSVKIKLN